ncbi:MAG: hypothetical protein ACM34K_15490 [Bacillota bacterium]
MGKSILRFISTVISISIISLASTINAQEKIPVKLSGLMFGDYFYNIEQRDSTKKDLNGFQFRRIYLTTDFGISESFDVRFRLEADQTAASNTSGGRIGVMVKDAYLRWKNIFKGSDLIFGLSPAPWIDIADQVWGYRSLEKTIMDFNGIVPSRDLGVDLRGAINEQSTVKYWVKVGNNSANAPEVNKYKRFYGAIQLLPINNFQLVLYGDYSPFAPRLDRFDRKTKANDAAVGAVILNFLEKERYSFAVESFYRMQQNNFSSDSLSALKDQTGFGLSVYGWFALSDIIRLVARFDSFDPNTDRDKDKSELIVGGVDFRVDKSVSIIPNIESVSYQGSDKKDLIGRVTFSFQF